jgi:hypothetical protein
MDQQQAPSSRGTSVGDFNTFDTVENGYAMPVFGDETFFTRSPPSNVDENFLNMLLTTGGMEINDSSPEEPEPILSPSAPAANVSLPKLEPDGTRSEQPSVPSTDMDITMRESQITEKKQERLYRLVEGFKDIDHNPGRKTKAEILAGYPSDAGHVMSLQMLKTYITSYWVCTCSLRSNDCHDGILLESPLETVVSFKTLTNSHPGTYTPTDANPAPSDIQSRNLS